MVILACFSASFTETVEERAARRIQARHRGLIDRRKTPTYSLSPDPGSSDTCILRFHGAPPLVMPQSHASRTYSLAA